MYIRKDNMKIATILFTYNRPIHTKKVLDSLAENTLKPEKLYIFHDGKKSNTDETAWNDVEHMIREVDWCDCQVFTSTNNKGLADSIITGVDRVFEENDAVIVLEDDCVTRKNFMKYMIDALHHYAERKEVYSVSAWSPLTNIPEMEKDVYVTGRIESWGWGTWKNNWKMFSKDYRILGRIKGNKELNEQFEIWGRDLETYIIGNIYGKCNSWAAFWGLNVIENKGYCIAPYKSFLINIGLDASGVHCGEQVVPSAKLQEETKEEFLFEDDLMILRETIENYKYLTRGFTTEYKEKYYRNLFQKWTSNLLKQKTFDEFFENMNIKTIYIWGKGAMADILLQVIPAEIDINIFNTNDYLSNRELCEAKIKESEWIVLIPGYDLAYTSYLVGEELSKKIIPLDELLNKMS